MRTDSARRAQWASVLSGTLLTIGFATLLVFGARSYGRTVVFALVVNWILMAWAIWLGRILESRSGAWDGLSVRLPASYYRTRPFEKRGRLYDYLGVRWYQRLFRRFLWSMDPARLRSEPDARQAMIRATQDPEAGHLVIFVVIGGITFWALANGWWDAAAWLVVFNMLHNGYPVMSVRQIRARLDGRAGTGWRDARPDR